jgi:hypothetical protein
MNEKPSASLTLTLMPKSNRQPLNVTKNVEMKFVPLPKEATKIILLLSVMSNLMVLVKISGVL